MITDDQTLNFHRLHAAEVIRLLYENGKVSQLQLLKMQIERSLEELEKKGATDVEERH